MNWRKQSKGLSSKQLKQLDEANHRAKARRTPLNTFVTFRPDPDRNLDGAGLAKMFAAIRNKVGVELRRRGIEPAFVWTIEANEEGSGVHMHMLIHVPAQSKEAVEKVIYRWLPEAKGVDVRDVYDQRAMNYVCKQLDHRAAWVRGLRYKPAPYAGKRCGVSKSLMVYAIKRHSPSVAVDLSPQQNRAA